MLAAGFSHWALWRLDLPGLHVEEAVPVTRVLEWMDHGFEWWTLSVGPGHAISEPLLTFPFIRLFGAGQISIRLFCFFAALAALLLFHRFAAVLFRDRLFAFAAAWLLGTSPTFTAASRQGFFYGLLMVPLVLGSLLLFFAWDRTGRFSRLALAVVLAGLALGVRSWLYLMTLSAAAAALVLERDLVKRFLRNTTAWGKAGLVAALIGSSSLPFLMYKLSRNDEGRTFLVTNMPWFNRGSPRTAYPRRVLGRLEQWNAHLDQTQYLDGAPIPPNRFSLWLFWMGALSSLWGLFRRRSPDGPGERFSRAALLSLGLYLLAVSLPVMVKSYNHLLCAYVLVYPVLLLYPFYLFLKKNRRALAYGLLLLFAVALSWRNFAMQRSYRAYLVETGGEGFESGVFAGFMDYAAANNVKTLIFYGRLSSMYARAAYFLSESRVAATFVVSLGEFRSALEAAGSDTGLVVYHMTDARFGDSYPQGLWRLLREDPSVEERLFFDRKGRPLLRLYMRRRPGKGTMAPLLRDRAFGRIRGL